MQCNFFNNDSTKLPRYGREEFDRLIGSYDACLDIPVCLFWRDLHKEYPDAKVILTTRDVDSWLKSANATVFKFAQMPFFHVWQYLDREETGPLFRMSRLVWKIFCGNCYKDEVCRRAYLDHCEQIRKEIPKEQLLEFRLGEHGWEELCRFLDKPVPDEPWPRAYPTGDFEEHINLAFRGAMWKIARWVGIFVMLVMGWFVIKLSGHGFHDEL